MNCWAHGLFGTPCSGQVDPHHLIKRQWLKREGLSEDEQNDPRVLRPVCRGHHGVIHSHSFHLYTHQMPVSVLDYADEKGVRWMLERQDQRRGETQS